MVNKYEIVKLIENFAPAETQEIWDCSGWVVETGNFEVNKIMIALTVTEDVLNQAAENNCDMIVSHHPMFFVPNKFKNTDIYCAHTNMDKADGGTTDILIKSIFPECGIQKFGDFLRFCELENPIGLDELIDRLKNISPHLRYTDNRKFFKKIAFCAGSGSDFIEDTFQIGADALVTGDVKFHTAIESPVTIFDIGHFESEIRVKKVFEEILKGKTEIIFANETSPFKYL